MWTSRNFRDRDNEPVPHLSILVREIFPAPLCLPGRFPDVWKLNFYFSNSDNRIMTAITIQVAGGNSNDFIKN